MADTAEPVPKDRGDDTRPVDGVVVVEAEEEEEEDEQTLDGSQQPKRKLGKTARRNQKLKAKRVNGERPAKPESAAIAPEGAPPVRGAPNVIVEYSFAAPVFPTDDGDPSMAAYAKIFERFTPVFQDDVASAAAAAAAVAEREGGAGATDEGAHGAGGDGASVAPALPRGGLSKKAQKRQLQDLVAVLKRQVSNPEVVESHDVTAPDARLLVHLKAYRNTVSVPRHWCHKRRYLQGKRGFIKPPFQLPDFILQTGIAKMRDADTEATDGKTLKSRTRERARPKMGRIEIDYQVRVARAYV